MHAYVLADNKNCPVVIRLNKDPDRSTVMPETSTVLTPYRSRPVRVILFSLGTVFLLLGIIGVILPLLPTTPFLILAASCYARTSKCFYHLLLNNRFCGSTLRQWQEDHCVPRRTKIVASGLLVVTLGSSILFFVTLPALKLVLSLFGIGLFILILCLPENP